MSLGPFDLNGMEFLQLYCVLLAFAVFAGQIIPSLMRPAGRPGSISDVEQIAFLAGGISRLSESVVAKLMAAGGLAVSAKGQVNLVSRDVATTPLEKAILNTAMPIRWKYLMGRVEPSATLLKRKLVQAGLMSDDLIGQRIRLMQTLPYAALLIFGATKLTIGLMRDRPVGFLAALLIATFIIGAIRFSKLDRRTEAGIVALESAARVSRRLRDAPTAPEMGHAVALFGTVVLAGSLYESLHMMRRGSDSGGNSGGGCGSVGGSGCGGSGCGGGGCGGCGS